MRKHHILATALSPPSFEAGVEKRIAQIASSIGSAASIDAKALTSGKPTSAARLVTNTGIIG